MTLRARMRWLAAASFATVVVAALLLQGVTAVVVALLALAPILLARRARLTADASGVTIVNLRKQRIPWEEITDFQLGRVAHTTCIDVCKRDGSRVHSWVATSGDDVSLSAIASAFREGIAQSSGRGPRRTRIAASRSTS